MSEKIYCIKLKCTAEKLATPPFPGELGIQIWENISTEAWKEWTKTQTMLINENRLNMADPQARKYLRDKMKSFLFDDQQIEILGNKS